MQADEALRHCMLKHFGTNQSCEIKVLEVTQFCQEKKKTTQHKKTTNQLVLRDSALPLSATLI